MGGRGIWSVRRGGFHFVVKRRVDIGRGTVLVPAMQDHDQETEVVEEDAAATEEIVEENENEEASEQEAPEGSLDSRS